MMRFGRAWISSSFLIFLFLVLTLMIPRGTAALAEQSMGQPTASEETEESIGNSTLLTLDEAIQKAEEHSYSLKLFQIDKQKMEKQNDDLRSVRNMTDKQLEDYFKMQSNNPMRSKSLTEMKTEMMILKEVTAEQLNTTVSHSVYQEEGIRLKLKADVEKAYFQVLQAQDQVKNMEAALANMKNLLKKTQSLFNQGLASQYDLTTAEIEKSKLENQLEQLRAREKVMLMGLNQIIGDPLERRHTLILPNRILLDLPYTLAALTEMAYENRPDYLSQQAAALFAEKTSEIYQKYYTYVSKEADRIKWEKEIDAEKERLKRDQFKEEISLQVAQSFTFYQTNILQAKNSLEEMKKAEDAYRIAVVRYENGLSTLDQVMSAKLKVDEAHSAETNSRFEVWNSIAQLSQTVGTDLFSSIEADRENQ